MDASTMYRLLWNEASCGEPRTSNDPTSPMAEPTHELFDYRVRFNVADLLWVGGSAGKKWAVANVLHFFAGTEDASMLAQYNPHTERFCPNGVWDGAYGAIAMPQIRGCIEELRRNPQSRRAIVSMGGYEPNPTINKPACWTSLHFMLRKQQLQLLVYQRSLNVAVFPYDLVLLGHILRYVAPTAGMAPGKLRWSIGSCHTVDGKQPRPFSMSEDIQVPLNVLAQPERCIQSLNEGFTWAS